MKLSGNAVIIVVLLAIIILSRMLGPNENISKSSSGNTATATQETKRSIFPSLTQSKVVGQWFYDGGMVKIPLRFNSDGTGFWNGDDAILWQQNRDGARGHFTCSDKGSEDFGKEIYFNAVVTQRGNLEFAFDRLPSWWVLIPNPLYFEPK